MHVDSVKGQRTKAGKGGVAHACYRKRPRVQCVRGPKAPSVEYHEGEANVTAVLEFGDMFYGGIVPKDHYIIQVEDGTKLETPGPTYNFDIMYNTSLSVNISAPTVQDTVTPFHLYYSMMKVATHALQ